MQKIASIPSTIPSRETISSRETGPCMLLIMGKTQALRPSAQVGGKNGRVWLMHLRGALVALENGHSGHSTHRYTRPIAFFWGGGEAAAQVVPGPRGTTGAQMAVLLSTWHTNTSLCELSRAAKRERAVGLRLGLGMKREESGGLIPTRLTLSHQHTILSYIHFYSTWQKNLSSQSRNPEDGETRRVSSSAIST